MSDISKTTVSNFKYVWATVQNYATFTCNKKNRQNMAVWKINCIYCLYSLNTPSSPFSFSLFERIEWFFNCKFVSIHFVFIFQIKILKFYYPLPPFPFFLLWIFFFSFAVEKCFLIVKQLFIYAFCFCFFSVALIKVLKFYVSFTP